MSKYIKLSQEIKPTLDAKDRKEMITDLEKSLEDKQTAIEKQQDQLEDMQKLDHVNIK